LEQLSLKLELRPVLQPDFDPQPVAVRIHRIRSVSRCKVHRCTARATTVAEKVDGAGAPIYVAPEAWREIRL